MPFANQIDNAVARVWGVKSDVVNHRSKIPKQIVRRCEFHHMPSLIADGVLFVVFLFTFMARNECNANFAAYLQRLQHGSQLALY